VTEEQVFLAVLDLPDEAARSAYLDEACGKDTAFRRQVEALIANHDRSGEFLDVPAAEQIGAGSGADFPVTIQSDAMSAEKKNQDDESDGLEFLTPSQRPDSLGRIGHYEVLQVLGKGGFGIVFRAFDDVLQRVVAIKVMAPQLAATSPARKRFLREARTSAAVRHENVVQVYEVGEQPLPYLAMEFIPGETLQQRLDRTGPLDVQETLRIGRQIAEGLAAAHATDLIHRDIKPGNVLLEGGQHKVKITDFGLARAADDASMTQSGMIAGTPMYMAPEQALGQTLDQRADLFSLGSVLYQMVAGRPPFRANTTVAVLKRVAEDTPRNIREITPETPQWLCDIIAKLHAKNPDERYQSAREVADVLADCEKQLAAHQELKDYARIPVGKPAPSRIPRMRQWAVAAMTGLLLFGTLMFFFFGGAFVFSDRGRLYMLNMGEVQIDEFHLAPFEIFILTSDTSPEFMRGAPLPPHVPLYVDPGTYHIKTVGKNQEKVQVWEIRSSQAKGEVVTRQESEECTLEFKRGEQLRVTVAKWGPDPLADASWVQLFNGKDLTGWKPSENWTVIDGALSSVVRAKSDNLVSERSNFENFHLRVEARIADGGNSGIFFRHPGTAYRTDFYEAEINSTHAILTKTGSLGNLGPQSAASEPPPKPNEWFTLEVIAVDNEFTIKVNGREAAHWTDPARTYKKGSIRLQQFGNTIVQFRKIEIKELPPEEPGWVQLFNGQDVPGTKTSEGHPDSWHVKDHVLVGTGEAGRMLRKDLQDFHCRIEAKVVVPGMANVDFRTTWSPAMTSGQAVLESRIAKNRTGGLAFYSAPQEGRLLVGSPNPPASSDGWFTMEIIAEGKKVTIKVNGATTAERTIPELPDRGALVLSVVDKGAVIHFRKIEIKELPGSSPEVPKQAADVLPFLAGNWKVERQQIDAEGKPQAVINLGQLTYDYVADGKILRGRGSVGIDQSQPLFLYSFDPAQNTLRQWQAWSAGIFRGPVTGIFNPENRTLLLRYKSAEGETDQQFTYVDADTIRCRFFNLDAKNKLVGEMHMILSRVKETVTIPASPIDPNRPEEAKVLDRFVGEWLNEQTVIDNQTPERPKVERVLLKAKSILGGRFIEMTDTNETTGVSGYTLTWFDPTAKQYRQWFFGSATEMTGAWDEAAKTMVLNSTDNTLISREVFKSDDLSEFKVILKDSSGKEVRETTGISRRVKELAPQADPKLTRLRSFAPGKDKLPVPLRSEGKEVVTVDGDSWRIENSGQGGNFNVMVAQAMDGLPKDGVLIFRARVKVEAVDKRAGGNLGFGGPNEVYIAWDQWPRVRSQYDGSDSDWIEKEARYPAADLKAETVYLYAGLHANGVLWLKDVELLHLMPSSEGRR
jgi:serine/threonine protein kinase